MRLMLAVVAAVAVSAGGVSQAATISYTSSQITRVYSPQSQDEKVAVESPDFDPSLGTLTSVSYTILGRATDDLVGENGNNTVFPANFSNYVAEEGAGFNQYGLYSDNSGSASTNAADNSFYINLTVNDLNSLGDYDVPGTNEIDFDAFSEVSNSATNKNVAYSDDTASFIGTVTETFTYTPVPEPGSLSILATAVFALLGFVGYRKLNPGR